MSNNLLKGMKGEVLSDWMYGVRYFDTLKDLKKSKNYALGNDQSIEYHKIECVWLLIEVNSCIFFLN